MASTRNARPDLLLGFFSSWVVGCHGGTFRVDEPLASTAPLVVDGELGMSAAACNGKQATKGLAADHEASASVGPSNCEAQQLRGKAPDAGS